MSAPDEKTPSDRASEWRAKLEKPVILPGFPQEADFKAASMKQLMLRLELLHESGAISPSSNLAEHLAVLDYIFPASKSPIFAARIERKPPKLDAFDLFKLLETIVFGGFASDVDVCEAFVKSEYAQNKFKRGHLDADTVRRNLSQIKQVLHYQADPDKLNAVQRTFLFQTMRFVEAVWLGIEVDKQPGRRERMAAYRREFESRQKRTPSR